MGFGIIEIISFVIYGIMLFLIIAPLNEFPVPASHPIGFGLLAGGGLIAVIASFFMRLPPYKHILSILKIVLLIGAAVYFGFIILTYSPLVEPLREMIAGGLASITGLINEQLGNAQSQLDTAQNVAGTL